MNELVNNLINFPTVNCITLEKSTQRQKFILESIEKYNLKYKFHYAYDAVNNALIDIAKVHSPFLKEMNSGEICAVISHLKSIHDWYYETDEEYGFFCEDDVLFSLSENWNFEWDEMIKLLPSNWGIIQLSLIRQFGDNDDYKFMKFHKYLWDNWSACCYIVSRKYAEKLIKFHCKGFNIFDLNLPYFPEVIPFIENVLYNADNKETAYTLPLFVENIEIPSSFYPKFIQSNLKDNQQYSSLLIKDWWNTIGKEKTANWFFND
jgi:GR25 family glycosyltransferase involved in LPS biosynthesis